MSHIQAIYQRGVFKPLEPVDLQEDQHVRLSIESAEGQAPTIWLQNIQTLQAGISTRHGSLPDSTSDIASDRQR